MAANSSWFVVCSLVLVLSSLLIDAVPFGTKITSSSIAGQWKGSTTKSPSTNVILSNSDNSGVARDLTTDHLSNPNNATSRMYFHQVFSKEASTETETKIGDKLKQGDNSASSKASTTRAPLAAPAASMPTSIQAVNKTVNGQNLNTSETQHYYGYEPNSWGFGTVGHDPYQQAPGTHVHYPPVPMDVINQSQSDDDANNSQNGMTRGRTRRDVGMARADNDRDYDDGDNDEAEEADDYDDEGEANDQGDQRQSGDDGDGEVTEEYNDEHAQKIIDEIDGDINKQERDDRDLDDFDHSASFTIPKIDPNTKGCKTVYKEIQTVPGKEKSLDDDFDHDFGWRRRRRRSIGDISLPAGDDNKATGDDKKGPKGAATSSSYILARECHFTEEDDDKRKKAAAAAKAATAMGAGHPIIPPMPIVANPLAKSGVPVALPKPRVTTGESRFVPINADPWRAPTRGPRGVRDPWNNDNGKSNSHLNYKQPTTPFTPADEGEFNMYRQGATANQDQKHFHQYPYPHFHIYYNRNGASTLNNMDGNVKPNETPTSSSEGIPNGGQRGEGGGDGGWEHNSPPYFEFTGRNDNEDNEGRQDDDDDGDDGGGDNGDSDDHGDGGDDGLAADTPNTPHSRRRRGLSQRLPYTMSSTAPKSRFSVLNDDFGWGRTIAGPNFYQSTSFVSAGGKMKPKKYSYNYYHREEPHDANDARKGGAKQPARPITVRASSYRSLTRDEPKRESKLEIDHEPPKKRSVSEDDGFNDETPNDDNEDYAISYGGGNFKEYESDYDSDKDRGNHQDQNGNHGHQGDDQQQHGEEGEAEVDDDF